MVWKSPGELPINNVNQQITNTKADRPKPTCHLCKKPGNNRNQCRLLKRQREPAEDVQDNPGNKNSGANTSNSNSNVNNNNTSTTTTKTVTEPKESQELFTHPVRHVKKPTTPLRDATLEPMQPIDRLPGTEDRKDKIRSHKEATKVTLMKSLKLLSKI